MTRAMIEAVSTTLESGKLNQWNNPVVGEFERKFTRHIGCKHAVAVFNGTVALELCIKALGLREGDEVIVTPRTFLASASCCAWYGINPVFADVDESSQNITLDAIKKAVTSRTKAVILVHLAGWPCDLEDICGYCREKGIYVIEDCAQAHGAKYKNKSVGTWGDINAWSFCQDKIITTGGEGGMVTTNCPRLYKLAWSIKDHGKGYDTTLKAQHPRGFRWLHDRIGTNWRMMPIQATIGVHALDALHEWVAHRREVARIYSEVLGRCAGVRVPQPPPEVYHSYYKYYFFLEPACFKISRDALIARITEAGVFCQVGSCGEVYRERALAGFAPERACKNARKLFDTAILLRCDPTISMAVARHTISVVKNILLENIVECRPSLSLVREATPASP